MDQIAVPVRKQRADAFLKEPDDGGLAEKGPTVPNRLPKNSGTILNTKVMNRVQVNFRRSGIVQVVEGTCDHGGSNAERSLRGDYASAPLAVTIQNRPGVVENV
ncbi:MAG TPA: hypothetical protein VJY15_26160 [Candidatus Acidoferrum sp.]|nr:hypothetical protein [Candidatus Acidoferrum sp.]